VQRSPSRFAAAVLSAPALDVVASALERKLAPVIASALPKLPMNKLDPRQLCHDMSVVDWYVNDPLNSIGGVTAALGNEILRTIDQAQAEAKQFTPPLLVIRGTEDACAIGSFTRRPLRRTHAPPHRICLKPGIEKFFDAAASQDKTFAHVPGCYHEIFNEPVGGAVGVVVDWVVSRVHGA